jgi:pimeloyl-ACP methyl ester carboxylesterase
VRSSEERIPYDEFSMFHENAEEFGLPYPGPPVVRRESIHVEPGRTMSALVWGEPDRQGHGTGPELVLLHGGAQNAHTWDTVALALDRPLVAVDLPGHGHSADARAGRYAVSGLAGDVAAVVDALAPSARAVVGMSLGGLTTLALADESPDLVRSVVLVDVTPGVTQSKAGHIAAFVNGPPSFPSFDELLARTVEFNPTRSVSSLRRGILHNAVQQEDGTWRWRHARPDGGALGSGERPDFGSLWGAVERIGDRGVPLMLVRGMQPQSVLDDADEAELLRLHPAAVVHHVEEAGHSVQGDAPLVLAALIADFVGR